MKFLDVTGPSDTLVSSLPSRGAWIEIGPSPLPPGRCWSLPSRGAWIEITAPVGILLNVTSRSPHGERGLKFVALGLITIGPRWSLPSRGAWIEIGRVQVMAILVTSSLPSRGAWIEIRRTPPTCLCPASLPSRGAWIEMIISKTTSSGQASRSPHGERGLKSAPAPRKGESFMSLPSRGAWIEISLLTVWSSGSWNVAPLTGSVD